MSVELPMKLFKRATVSRSRDAPDRAGASAEDRTLVARLLARDAAAFTSLVRAQHESLVRLALVFVGNRATAEELAQDTWARVLAALPEFEGRSSLRTWMFRICTNAALTRVERESHSAPFSSLQHSDGPEVEPQRFNESGAWADPPHAWRAET